MQSMQVMNENTNKLLKEKVFQTKFYYLNEIHN